jgi:uncharacterized protein (TIGR02147 family)
VNNPGYSHRVFAKQAGLSSPSHLLMIIKGTRNLSQKTIPKFAEGLKLNSKEKKYFELMVLFNQTEDLQMKARYFSEIMSLKGALKGLHDLEKEKYEFLSRWYVVAIYVLIDTLNFNPDPNRIAKRLGGQITASQAKEALENLQKLGLIKEDSNRKLRQASGAITVADDTRSVAVFNYHQSMIRLAADTLRKRRPDQREINGATVSIPIEKLSEIKEKIRAFRKEINQLASSFENSDEVYQLNIQFFPLTTPEEK